MTRTAEMKATLKAAGINTKLVSITHEWAGYSEAYRVTLKSKDIDRKTVEALLKPVEAIDRDEVTREILAGGNTYVFVSYDWRL